MGAPSSPGLLLSIALGAWAAAPPLAAAPRGDDGAARAAAVEKRNESLRHQLELAEGDDFYLLLDPDTSVLTLMYKGAPLRETPIVEAEVGEPRARRGAAEEAVDLSGLWTGGTLEPPRLDVREEVVPPQTVTTPGAPSSGRAPDAEVASPAPQGEFLSGEAPGGAATPTAEEEVEIPKTPEELYPVPERYEIRFAEGLTIEVVRAPGGAETSGAAAPGAGSPVPGDAEPRPYPTPVGPGLFERIVRLFERATLTRPEGERVRLRLHVGSRDADLLFRSLPPDVKLLIRLPEAGS